MENNLLKIFIQVWLIVVISVLSIFCLCKIGGTWFNMPPAHSGIPQSAQERMYNACLENTESNHSDQCNSVLKEVK